MISIIVSSYKEDLFHNFSRNVKETIGQLPYEIIKIHNPGLMGICEAYNDGAAQAQFPYLVFSHEDILFHTPDWGNIIKDVFDQDEQIGLIGCAGGLYKSALPSGWAADSRYSSTFMIGTHYGSSHLSKTYKAHFRGLKLTEEKNIPQAFREPTIVNEQVIMLDGMFLVTRKIIHEAIKFDQNTFKKFHCYDLDYSFQINEHYKVVVNHNILVEHLSAGNFGAEWLDEMTLFNKKWDALLPCSLYPVSDLQKRKLEFASFEQLLRIYKQSKISVLKPFKPVFQISYIKKIGIINWLLLIFKILKKFISYSFGALSNSAKKLPPQN